jgi:hypothetical protein
MAGAVTLAQPVPPGQVVINQLPQFDPRIYAPCNFQTVACNQTIIVDGYPHVPYPVAVYDGFDYAAWWSLWSGYAYPGYYTIPVYSYVQPYYGGYGYYGYPAYGYGGFRRGWGFRGGWRRW